ncbi:UPF0481 protein [Cinnamomum micranthum f. kanehirae]|uniref:UPF0481 protein n=1 Tax=Cinnamomum micranthum f. kanehirae TaxID=337451 RepID=A0A3S3NKK5_9MAGN|nr:UPF0481 protein [Cinnamomum micranthum f. kanehirae]
MPGESWKSSITTHLKRRDSSTVTICKVPERLRRGKTDAYEPRIISLGPYHHGKPNLQAMEKYKRSFLEVILSFRPQIPRKRYIKVIKKEEEKIRTCYTDANADIDSEKFVEMILIDACFLVGYLLHIYYDVRGVLELDSIVGMDDLIRYDILLLENQLPFFILIKIFDLLELTPLSFMDLAIKYLNCWEGEKKVDFQPPESFHHLLHLSHSHCLFTPQVGKGSLVSTHGKEPDPIDQPPSASVLPAAVTVTISEEESGPIHRPQPPSATVLHEAGVKFEKKEAKGSSSLDVTFNNGKMMIPPLVIDTFNMSRLRNLVAFEQLYPNFNELDKSFTAYVEFMDFIVNTPEDVALLHKEGIICHFLGSDQNAADFLNDLNKGVYVKSDHYLAPLYNAVYDYQQKRINKWQAILHFHLNLIDELGKEKGLLCLFLILELVTSR